MSMMAEFVQIAPDRLRDILDDPDSVEELFQPDTPAFSPRALPQMNEAMRERIRATGPAMIKTMMERMEQMDPRLRDQITRSLANIGITAEALQSGTAGSAIEKMMEMRSRLTAMGQQMQSQARPSAGAPDRMSMDKAWNGVHYLLCGSIAPTAALLSQPIMGGTEIGDDMGYGPARYFDAPTVARIASALSDPNLENDMKARFDPAAMDREGIYPGGWSQPDQLAWLLDAFRSFRDFYNSASSKGFAIVTALT